MAEAAVLGGARGMAARDATRWEVAGQVVRSRTWACGWLLVRGVPLEPRPSNGRVSRARGEGLDVGPAVLGARAGDRSQRSSDRHRTTCTPRELGCAPNGRRGPCCRAPRDLWRRCSLAGWSLFHVKRPNSVARPESLSALASPLPGGPCGHSRHDMAACRAPGWRGAAAALVQRLGCPTVLVGSDDRRSEAGEAVTLARTRPTGQRARAGIPEARYGHSPFAHVAPNRGPARLFHVELRIPPVHNRAAHTRVAAIPTRQPPGAAATPPRGASPGGQWMGCGPEPSDPVARVRGTCRAPDAVRAATSLPRRSRALAR